jgi:AcrR family transcriptional regulator
MKTVAEGPVPNRERTQRAREKIVAAAIELIAERGLVGFPLCDVGARAGVSRALARYHFTTREAVIAAAADTMLRRDEAPANFGLEPLMHTISALLKRAEARDPQLLALLELAMGVAAPRAVPEQQRDYWHSQIDHFEKHLMYGQHRREVRRTIEARQLAPLLLGQVHGELLRILATGAPSPATFLESLRQQLSQSRGPPPGPKPPRAPGEPSRMGELF